MRTWFISICFLFLIPLESGIRDAASNLLPGEQWSLFDGATASDTDLTRDDVNTDQDDVDGLLASLERLYLQHYTANFYAALSYTFSFRDYRIRAPPALPFR